MTDTFTVWSDAFTAWSEKLATEKADRLARRRELRGKGFCAICENPATGMDFPAAEHCAGFFGGELEPGDGVCWWCIEAWAIEPDDRLPDGRA
jgi:hypothetical protein